MREWDGGRREGGMEGGREGGREERREGRNSTVPFASLGRMQFIKLSFLFNGVQ